LKPAFEDSDAKTRLVHREVDLDPARPLVRRASYTGNFGELQCSGQAARVVMETSQGKKVLLIEDPTLVSVNGKNGETRDLTCGPQKPVQIRVEYDPAVSNRPGVDGVVRVIHFEE
jgi:hypothetical protein